MSWQEIDPTSDTKTLYHAKLLNLSVIDLTQKMVRGDLGHLPLRQLLSINKKLGHFVLYIELMLGKICLKNAKAYFYHLSAD